jgi:acyl carrier protein
VTVVVDLPALIAAELAAIVAEKGETLPALTADSVFLGGGLPVDSLDLATLLVVLEQKLKVDPFRRGFRRFTTAGELAALYAAELQGTELQEAAS